MKPRRVPALSAGERRNADLFFADLMGRHSASPTEALPERNDADRFLADLLGGHAEPRGSGGSLAPTRTDSQRLLPAGQTLTPSEDEWSESGPCPDREEVEQTWLALAELQKLLKADRKEIDSNPLVIEVQMLKQLMDVLDMANDVPAKVWGEIWDELKAFASCDVKPLVARVKKGEKHANAVLRVLHGLTSILQGYVHDRIDAGFKSRLDAKKGWSKAVATLMIHVIKKQVPVIQREIKAQNFAAVATAFQGLKTELGGQGVSVTGVWDIVVTLAKEIIGNAIEDAIKNTARWAVKKLGKTLLKSAAKAASVIFILEDVALLVHALVYISSYKRRLREFNRVLLGFLRQVRHCDMFAARAGERHTTWVKWRRQVGRLECRLVLHSFAPEKGGKPGEGEWQKATVEMAFDGKSRSLVSIDVPATETHGGRALRFLVPPVSLWPAKGTSFLSLDVTWFTAAGTRIGERSMFVAAAVP